MASTFDYDTFVARNRGYIPAPAQRKIGDTAVMVAGCGIGSALAVCAARLGFRRFILVDGDVVDAHNLNRQFYAHADIGRPKVEALASHILAINPEAWVTPVHAYLDELNTDGLVAQADLVFDTVDFLDLPAILRLHGCAHRRGKPIFTALNAGFGALVWFFPAHTAHPLAQALSNDLRQAGAGQGEAPGAPHAPGPHPVYADVFAAFMGRISPHLDPEVVEEVARVLAGMKEGKPCPASQVAVGTFCVAAMAASMAVDWVCDRPVVSSPTLLVHSFRSHRTQFVDTRSGGAGA